jgi:uroporphyrinogen decarboxylase
VTAPARPSAAVPDALPHAASPDAPFLRACRRQPAAHTPVWLMRQAGRYMPVYRALRAKHTMLEIIASPELSAEVTMQPIEAFPLDAAIIFSDILPPLIGMGLDLQFLKGEGPHISNRVDSARDADMLAAPPAEESMAPTLEAIRLVKRELHPRGVPLIGFAGAPFTLACYAIEGGGSKNFERAKTFMYTEPAAWARLMKKLVTVVSDLLLAQARAGADALQVFDSWAGVLSPYDYDRYVRPHMESLHQTVAKAGVPVINFGTGTAGMLEQVAACGGDVVGVDWRVPLDRAWERIGHDRAIMGNLDPLLLLAPWRELRPQIDDVLDRAAGRPGHIFNLGHGVLPPTSMDNVRRLVDHVHERTSNVRQDEVPDANVPDAEGIAPADARALAGAGS